jgi:hypothetical protein
MNFTANTEGNRIKVTVRYAVIAALARNCIKKAENAGSHKMKANFIVHFEDNGV